MTGPDGLGPALVVLGASTRAARSPDVHEIERRAFRSVNGLPDTLHPVLLQALRGAGKAMKRRVGRDRPVRIVDDVQVRSNEERGLGFPSGHAAVAFCLATLVAPGLPKPARPFAWGVAAAVAAGRVYVGAHLPLDVVGGAALGVVGGRCAYFALDATRP